jgi:hypothetical protein
MVWKYSMSCGEEVNFQKCSGMITFNELLNFTLNYCGGSFKMALK